METNPNILNSSLISKVYDAAISPGMKQVGAIIENTIKGSRLLLAPIDYAAALHTKWERYLKRIAENVSEENLIEGSPEIVIPTIEGLNRAREGTEISQLLLNLLEKSLDKNKQDIVHPAFVRIIEQLSRDEAVMIKKIGEREVPYTYKALLDTVFEKGNPPVEKIFANEFPVEDLHFGNNFEIYRVHLIYLNLITVPMFHESKPDKTKEKKPISVSRYLKLTEFGALFYKACVI